MFAQLEDLIGLVAGAAKELHDLLVSRGVKVWFSEKDVALGTPLVRETEVLTQQKPMLRFQASQSARSDVVLDLPYRRVIAWSSVKAFTPLFHRKCSRPSQRKRKAAVVRFHE